MSEQKANSESGPLADGDAEGPERAPPPFLRTRPKHFFSNKFELEIVENYPAGDDDRQVDKTSGWLNRFIDLNLLLMIMVIGAPILLYCIVAASK